ncbi:unnamed protein product [Macrosiphum euphorbiae]|uniref:Uncharacterized protein n=1 Tax=Macrosiphum euphorbiae TaxID=13131 RepID=A0AAV0XG57_9HEMI|nr:unnamed protein product [Macrosiphum euphorbiae]
MIIEIKRISHQNFWIENFMTQKILIENEVVTLKEALKVISDYSFEYSTELDMNVVLKAAKALSTAQKCKYSDLIIHTFRIFFNIFSSCRKLSIDNLKNDNVPLSNTIKTSLYNIIKLTIELKTYTTRFIFNIYHFMNLIPTLKSTDHTLIKSLLSINLNLDRIKSYIDQHQDEASEFDLLHFVQKVIAQMINVVERFRCKQCYIENYYDLISLVNNKITCIKLNNTDNNSVGRSIEESIDNLKKFFHDPSYLINDIPFSVYMYDQKYMLLEDIFEIKIDTSFIIPDLIVEWKNSTKWPTLGNVLKEVKSTYSLQNIFEYQVFLIEVIKSAFYIKYMKKELITSTVDIEKSLNEFDAFINKMIPKNYPTDLYGLIKKLRNSLYNYLELSKSTSVLPLSIFSVQQLRKVLINTSWVHNENCEESNINTTIESLPMNELVSRIVKLDNFKVFIQIFEELSYESNTLSDYDIQTVSNLKPIKKSDNIPAYCKHFSFLREKLLLFQILIVGFQQACDSQEEVDDSDVKKAKLFIFEILMNLFQTYTNYEKFKKIILPLTIYFKYNDETNENLKILLQVLFLNINIIEHFELNHCDLVEYSIDVYYNKIEFVFGHFTHNFLEQERCKLDKLLWDNKNEIMKNMINTSYYHIKDERRDIHLMAVDQFIRTVDFISNNISDNPDQDVSVRVFLWDGSMESVESVYSAITRCVIDYQYLVRHQCSIIKWFVSLVVEYFLKINQIYINLKKQNKYTQAIEFENKRTKKYLTEFEEIPFSKSINIYLHNILNFFEKSFDDFMDKNTERSMLLVNIDQFTLSQPSYEENSTSLVELKNMNKIINNNILFLHNVVQNLNDNKYISTDVQFSTCIYV